MQILRLNKSGGVKILASLAIILQLPVSGLDIRYNGKIYNNIEIVKVTDGNDVIVKDSNGDMMTIPQKTGTPGTDLTQEQPAAEESKGGASWLTDYNSALETAKKNNMLVLALFTGSDWCSFCKKLEKDVLDTRMFKTFAEKNVILFKADFPRSKAQPDVLKKQNSELRKKFDIKGFPTILFINPFSGDELEKKTGYRGDGPANYINDLKAIIKKNNPSK